MKTYSVKQIADMLETNPETVRRWIRDKKLKAVQVSRKEGNIITEDELERFLRATPKYLPIFSANRSILSSVIGMGTIAGGIIASALLSYLNEKGKTNVRIKPEDFKEYLNEAIVRLEGINNQKQELIHQTQEEISNNTKRIAQYRHLLEREDIMEETLGRATGINGKGD